MTDKEYLHAARRLKSEIECKSERLMRLKAMAERSGGGVVAATHKKGYSSGMDAVDAMLDYADEVERQAAQLVRMQHGIQQSMQRIQRPEHRMVLEMYYLDGIAWQEVSCRMGYSLRHVYRLHNDALRSFIRQ